MGRVLLLVLMLVAVSSFASANANWTPGHNLTIEMDNCVMAVNGVSVPSLGGFIDCNEELSIVCGPINDYTASDHGINSVLVRTNQGDKFMRFVSGGNENYNGSWAWTTYGRELLQDTSLDLTGIWMYNTEDTVCQVNMVNGRGVLDDGICLITLEPDAISVSNLCTTICDIDYTSVELLDGTIITTGIPNEYCADQTPIVNTIPVTSCSPSIVQDNTNCVPVNTLTSQKTSINPFEGQRIVSYTVENLPCCAAYPELCAPPPDAGEVVSCSLDFWGGVGQDQGTGQHNFEDKGLVTSFVDSSLDGNLVKTFKDELFWTEPRVAKPVVADVFDLGDGLVETFYFLDSGDVLVDGSVQGIKKTIVDFYSSFDWLSQPGLFGYNHYFPISNSRDVNWYVGKINVGETCVDSGGPVNLDCNICQANPSGVQNCCNGVTDGSLTAKQELLCIAPSAYFIVNAEETDVMYAPGRGLSGDYVLGNGIVMEVNSVSGFGGVEFDFGDYGIPITLADGESATFDYYGVDYEITASVFDGTETICTDAYECSYTNPPNDNKGIGIGAVVEAEGDILFVALSEFSGDLIARQFIDLSSYSVTDVSSGVTCFESSCYFSAYRDAGGYLVEEAWVVDVTDGSYSKTYLKGSIFDACFGTPSVDCDSYGDNVSCKVNSCSWDGPGESYCTGILVGFPWWCRLYDSADSCGTHITCDWVNASISGDCTGAGTCESRIDSSLCTTAGCSWGAANSSDVDSGYTSSHIRSPAIMQTTVGLDSDYKVVFSGYGDSLINPFISLCEADVTSCEVVYMTEFNTPFYSAVTNFAVDTVYGSSGSQAYIISHHIPTFNYTFNFSLVQDFDIFANGDNPLDVVSEGDYYYVLQRQQQESAGTNQYHVNSFFWNGSSFSHVDLQILSGSDSQDFFRKFVINDGLLYITGGNDGYVDVLQVSSGVITNQPSWKYQDPGDLRFQTGGYMYSVEDILYLGASNSNGTFNGGFVALDVSDPSAIVELGRHVIEDDCGRFDFVRDGDYLYGIGQCLQVWDVSDQSNPVDIVHSAVGFGEHIYKYGSNLYIEDVPTTNTVSVVDVSTPSSPFLEGYLPIAYGGYSDSEFSYPYMFVSQNYNIHMIDMSVPQDIVIANSYTRAISTSVSAITLNDVGDLVSVSGTTSLTFNDDDISYYSVNINATSFGPEYADSLVLNKFSLNPVSDRFDRSSSVRVPVLVNSVVDSVFDPVIASCADGDLGVIVGVYLESGYSSFACYVNDISGMRLVYSFLVQEIKPNSFTTVDIDDDGVDEIVSAGGVYRSTGATSFDTLVEFASGAGDVEVSLVDWNADSFVDVFLTSAGVSRSLISSPGIVIGGTTNGTAVASACYAFSVEFDDVVKVYVTPFGLQLDNAASALYSAAFVDGGAISSPTVGVPQLVLRPEVWGNRTVDVTIVDGSGVNASVATVSCSVFIPEFEGALGSIGDGTIPDEPSETPYIPPVCGSECDFNGLPDLYLTDWRVVQGTPVLTESTIQLSAGTTIERDVDSFSKVFNFDVRFLFTSSAETRIYIYGESPETGSDVRVAELKLKDGVGFAGTSNGYEQFGYFTAGEYYIASFVLDVVSGAYSISMGGANTSVSFITPNVKHITGVGIAVVNGLVEVDYAQYSGSDAHVSLVTGDELRESAALRSLADCSLPENNGWERDFETHPAGSVANHVIIDNYCRILARSSGYCSVFDLQTAIAQNADCYYEAHNYCQGVTFPRSAGFQDDEKIAEVQITPSLGGEVACTAVLGTAAGFEKVVSPILSNLWFLITDNFIIVLLLIMVIMIFGGSSLMRRKR